MKIIYCENWHRIKKEPRRVLDASKANEMFVNGEHFFAVIFKDNLSLPSWFIEFFSNESISVSHLDSDLEERATFNYRFVKDNDRVSSEKMVLVQFIVREKNENGEQVSSSACNTMLFIDEKWELQEHFFCQEVNYPTKESYSFFSKNRVSEANIYMDYPKFGGWENLLNQNIPRVTDE